MSFEELNFDSILPAEVPVRLNHKPFILREATGTQGCTYRNKIFESTQLGDSGKPVGVSGMADADPLLVSLCLYEVKEDGSKAPVTYDFVMSLPYKVITALAERAKQISGLLFEGKPKNEGKSSGDGSA